MCPWYFWLLIAAGTKSFSEYLLALMYESSGWMIPFRGPGRDRASEVVRHVEAAPARHLRELLLEVRRRRSVHTDRLLAPVELVDDLLQRRRLGAAPQVGETDVRTAA